MNARTIWTREAERAQGQFRQHLSTISDAVNHGETMADALRETGDFFPALFREMVGLGEQTGKVDAVLAQLADHYQNQLTLRRNFWSAITWPLVQLGIAVAVVGLLIWVQGMIGVDILGFGLVGDRGLTIYAMFLAAVARDCFSSSERSTADWFGRPPSNASSCGFPESENRCKRWPSRGWPGRCT